MATIAINADGTCFAHAYPYIGQDIGAVPVLKALVNNGHNLILWTMRDREKHGQFTIETTDHSPEIKITELDCLQEVLDWFKEKGIPVWSVNKNPTQTWSTSRKVYAQLYIDDAALGVPLARFRCDSKQECRPFVNWKIVTEQLCQLGLVSSTQKEEILKHWTVDIVPVQKLDYLEENITYDNSSCSSK